MSIESNFTQPLYLGVNKLGPGFKNENDAWKHPSILGKLHHNDKKSPTFFLSVVSNQ